MRKSLLSAPFLLLYGVVSIRRISGRGHRACLLCGMLPPLQLGWKKERRLETGLGGQISDSAKL